MKIEFNTYEELETFVELKLAGGEHVVQVSELVDGKFAVQVLENKMYTSQDGKQFVDEVWTTKDGEMVFVQDLSEAHCQNVLRMILRNSRELQAIVAEIRESLVDYHPDADSAELALNKPIIH